MSEVAIHRLARALRGGLCLAAAMQVLMVASAAAGPYHPPRDRQGHPDLQGLWANASMTPLTRPATLTSLVVTAAQAAAFERGGVSRYEAAVAPLAGAEIAPPPPGQVTDDAPQWAAHPTHLAQIDGQFRSSIIVEPADGTLPLRPEARAAARVAEAADLTAFDNPEDRHFGDRCLLTTIAQQPPYIRNALQIVQTADSVVLLGEGNHDARIVRLNDRKHLPASVTPWMGDSVGWWEGDTLVVETTNFNPSERWHRTPTDYMPIGPHARVVERFTRTAADTVLYRFEVSDPGAYTQTWRGEMPIRAMAGRIFEYACHEGNYSMANVLAGARHDEAVAGR